MKNAVNSILFVSLFSSLIFIVNCDSSSTRSIKASMPNGKVNTANFPPCTEKIMNLITSRKTTADDLKKKIEELKGHDLSSSEKALLNSLIDDLKKKSNQVYDEIHAIKSKPEGCNAVSADNKKIPHSIATMKAENQSLGKKVVELTGQSNVLANSSEETDAATLIENQSYTLKSELARVMNKSKVENMYVMGGKIYESANAMADLRAMDSTKEFCYLELSSGELTSAEEVRVLRISSGESDNKKSIVSKVLFIANGDQLNSFICSVPNSSDVPTRIRNVFGELITLKNGVSSSPQSDGEVQVEN